MRHAIAAAGARARRGGAAGVARRRAPAQAPRGARPRPRGADGRVRPRPADRDGLPRPRTTCWCSRRPAARSSASSTGRCRGVVLDLPVNSASERGLLGIALHPKLPPQRLGLPVLEREPHRAPTATTLDDVRLLGNRVDRFEWDGRTLEFDRNIIQFRAFQADADQPLRGNHDGGVLRFGPDGKLYVIVGDTGRRGQLQNLVDGPFGPGMPDDQFGGPEPDDAHLTGVILRLNDDGSAPRDNPFFRAGRVDGRRGRREPPEALRVRPPQLVRHGLRPRVGRPVGAGERRRHASASSTASSPGMNSRLGADHGPGVARRPVQGDRDRPDGAAAVRAERLLRPAADPLAADQHRRHARAGAGAPVHAARRASSAIPS